MKVFNKIMLCLAFFLIIDQESIGNTTLSEAFGHEALVNIEEEWNKPNILKKYLRSMGEKVKEGLNILD